VEYIRALGLSPQVLASSNHLGNNDMLNLTNKKTLDAKMRVKGDIFGPWQENIDHQVRVMYTPLIGDEKRDIVEYTSMGFMSCPHTMLTYTRAMDSALCVPLMIDVAVWCDFFSRCGAPSGLVGQATAYLFKVPEGGALGVDPGFFCQMQRLEEALEVAANSVSEFRRGSTGTDGSSLVRGGRIVCVGLSCLDLQLCGSTKGGTSETINTFTETKYCAGGSCPQVASVLAGMGLDRVTAITKVGADSHGNELVRLMQAAGVRCEQVIRDPLCQTALAVLPIFSDGGRGCYVNLAANNDFKPEEVENALRKVSAALPDEYQDCCRGVAAMHFGYPHFLPKMQGRALANLLASSQNILGEALISVDLNGVDNSDSARSRHDDVLGPSFPAIDLLHANEEEARAISGESGSMEAVGAWFLQRGVGIFAVTLGENGAYIAVADAARVAKSPALAHQALKWAGQCMKLPAFRVQDLSSINTNGAGDAFCAGMLVSLCWQQPLTLRQALQMGLLSSLQRVDGRLRDAGVKKSAKELMDGILNI
jgi:sugar/nucleoside kinase (ribokinase family)